MTKLRMDKDEVENTFQKCPGKKPLLLQTHPFIH